MHTLRSDINYTVTGLILYTLLHYGVFALESLVYRAWVWMTVSDSIARSHRLAELETAALQSGVSSIAAVLLGVVFLHFYFRKTISPAILRQKKQPMLPKSFLLLTCIFMGAQLIYSLFGNLLEFSLRALGYTAMEQLTVASAQSATVSMFLYTAIFAPLGEELIYRGFLLRRFQKYGNVFAIFFSALLFGVMHGNLFQIPFAFLTGLVLGYTAVEFSLVWSILLHIINNFLFGEALEWLMQYFPATVQDYLHRGINIFFFAFAAFWLLRHREQLKAYFEKNGCSRKTCGSALTAIAMLVFLIGNFGLALSGIHHFS